MNIKAFTAASPSAPLFISSSSREKQLIILEKGFKLLQREHFPREVKQNKLSDKIYTNEIHRLVIYICMLMVEIDQYFVL